MHDMMVDRPMTLLIDDSCPMAACEFHVGAEASLARGKHSLIGQWELVT